MLVGRYAGEKGAAVAADDANVATRDDAVFNKGDPVVPPRDEANGEEEEEEAVGKGCLGRIGC